MTELEKMLAGGLYDFSDAELAEQFREGRRRVERFNRTPADDAAAYAAALGALIPGIPASAKVVQPFYCDLGWRIELGEEVFVNMGCTFLDCGGVRIGARTKLGPNCQPYTPQHPVDYLDRRRPVETSFRITIGEDCWHGGGVVVCPGVTIGDRSVVAAGSVVVRDIPADSLAAGHPAADCLDAAPAGAGRTGFPLPTPWYRCRRLCGYSGYTWPSPFSRNFFPTRNSRASCKARSTFS